MKGPVLTVSSETETIFILPQTSRHGEDESDTRVYDSHFSVDA